VGAVPKNTVISSRCGGVFMSKTQTTQKWALASVALRDAYTDFILSTGNELHASTLAFYRYTAGKFLEPVMNFWRW
jgi:hypothetical protein